MHTTQTTELKDEVPVTQTRRARQFALSLTVLYCQCTFFTAASHTAMNDSQGLKIAQHNNHETITRVGK